MRERKRLKPLRVQLDRCGKRRLHEIASKKGKVLKYEEAKPIAGKAVSVWMVQSDLGELRFLVCHVDMRIEQVVDLILASKWRKKFVVGMVSAANVLIQTGTGSLWYADDGRRVNQSMEVVQ